MDTQEYLSLTFKFDVFHSEKNGYCVYKYKEEKGGTVTCVGYNLPTNKSITYRMVGKRTIGKYGPQFVVEDYEEIVGDGKEAIIAYLSSGLFPGIGKTTAKRIYETFKSDSVRIIEESPEELKKIKGISSAKVEKIIDSCKQNHFLRDVTKYLSLFDVSPKCATNVAKKLNNHSLAELKADPYKLIGKDTYDFLTADRIAKAEDISYKCDARMNAGLHYLFNRAFMSGNLGIKLEELSLQMNKLLLCETVTQEDIHDYLSKQFGSKELVLATMDFGEGSKRYVFQKFVVEMEDSCADRIAALCGKTHSISEAKDMLHRFEKEKNITLDTIQEQAVLNAFSNSLSIISGGPGTGKTTLIEAIAYIYKMTCEGELMFAAPTARAARRIKEQTGYSGTTLHSLLGIRPSENEMERENDEEFTDSLIIVDEFSMVDAFLAYHFFNAIGENCKVVIVGDAEQLPSVGPGAVLRDLISSKMVPTTMLENVYRQNPNTKIYTNARKIAKGDCSLENGDDFKMYECSDMKKIEDTLVYFAEKAVRRYGLENVMVLAPFKKSEAGVEALNTRIQDILNPKTSEAEVKFGQTVFRKGDFVMQTVNDNEASNGDTGVVESVEKKEDGNLRLIVRINDGLKEYAGEDIGKLTLAYARTYHKSQGSEAKCVLMCLTNAHSVMLVRNMPYTAITRAKELCVLIGEQSALNKAITNTSPLKRITTLELQLKKYSFQKVEGF